MAATFATRWEVISPPRSHGSLVETARVRPLTGLEATGESEAWVERPRPTATEAQRAVVRRRWHLASRLNSPRWPQLLDWGEDASGPWAVLEATGHGPEGTFPHPRLEQGLKEVRALAWAVAEAEGLVESAFTRPALSPRPALLSRSPAGRLMFELAALDAQPDEGFGCPAEWRLFTPEALMSLPATARTNAFALGWMLCLVLTGRCPYELGPAGLTREAVEPLILGGRVRPLGLPEHLKAAEPIIRRALAPQPSGRPANAAAFAEAMGVLAQVPSEARLSGREVTVVGPPWPIAEEQLPAALEAELTRRLDEPSAWLELADRLEVVNRGDSVRASLIRAHQTVDSPSAPTSARAEARQAIETLLRLPGVTPGHPLERLGLGWKLGYVRMLATRPAGELPGAAEAHVAALVGLLRHPSLRFLQLLSLNGPLPHVLRWVEALQRQPPPALKRVHITGLAQGDPAALDIAYRFPRWTWTWGKAKRESLWTRLFSPG